MVLKIKKNKGRRLCYWTWSRSPNAILAQQHNLQRVTRCWNRSHQKIWIQEENNFRKYKSGKKRSASVHYWT